MCGFLFGLIVGAFIIHYLSKEKARNGRGWNNSRAWVKGFQQQLNPLVGDEDYALFQQWRQQQGPALSSNVPRTPGTTYTQGPAFNIDSVRSSAIEGVDKALDVLLLQVQGLKETLAQHKAVVEEKVASGSQASE